MGRMAARLGTGGKSEFRETSTQFSGNFPSDSFPNDNFPNDNFSAEEGHDETTA
jgi:hypothetical protein